MSSPHSLSLEASARLESLRGLAAMMVAMFHCLLVLESSHSTRPAVEWAIVLFNGRAAVTLFFVLSGLVLGLSLRRSNKPPFYNCAAYCIRRFFRIYPAFFVTTLLVAALIPIYRHIPPSDSKWMNVYFPPAVSFFAMLKNLTFYDLSFNRVTWTLKMELICSFLLPVCFYGHRVFRWFPWILLGAAVLIAHGLNAVVSLAVIQAFLVGYIFPETAGWWKRIENKKVAGLVLIFLSMAAICLPRSHSLYIPTATLIEAIGAATLIGCVTYGAQLPFYRVLDWHPVKVAGQTSYSYYLIQPIVLMPVTALIFPSLQAMFGHHPIVCAAILWLASSVIAFPLAWISYKAIERPFINMGKALMPHVPSIKKSESPSPERASLSS